MSSRIDLTADIVNMDRGGVGRRIRHSVLLFPILSVVRQFPFFLFVCLTVFGLSGCSQKAEQEAKVEAPPAIPLPPKDTRPTIVCFGDSITAGYGIEAGKSYPDHLQKILDAKGYKFRVVNAGISGDTTSGGMDRLNDALGFEPKVTLLELGGNDGLRGIPVTSSRDALTQIAARLEAKGSKVLLLGITLPRNYGPDYIHEFESMYQTLAKSHNYPFMPFVLEGAYGKPGMMQQDGIHPTAAGAAIVAQNVFRYLEPLLKQ